MDNVDEFLAHVQSIRPDIDCYDDAFSFAFNSVETFDGDCSGERLFFGRLGSGTFFSSSSLDSCRFWPDTCEVEALGILRAELGDWAADQVC